MAQSHVRLWKDTTLKPLSARLLMFLWASIEISVVHWSQLDSKIFCASLCSYFQILFGKNLQTAWQNLILLCLHDGWFCVVLFNSMLIFFLPVLDSHLIERFLELACLCVRRVITIPMSTYGLRMFLLITINRIPFFPMLTTVVHRSVFFSFFTKHGNLLCLQVVNTFSFICLSYRITTWADCSRSHGVIHTTPDQQTFDLSSNQFSEFSKFK